MEIEILYSKSMYIYISCIKILNCVDEYVKQRCTHCVHVGISIYKWNNVENQQIHKFFLLKSTLGVDFIKCKCLSNEHAPRRFVDINVNEKHYKVVWKSKAIRFKTLSYNTLQMNR